MLHESTQYEHNTFVTLTFDDEHLEHQVTKRTAQLFLKRLRRHLDKKIRYYLAAEYGANNGRAHYHAILFNIETCGKCKVCSKVDRLRGKMPEKGTDCYKLMQAWDKGQIHAGTVEPESCRYVADYLQKDTRPEAYGNKQPPFSLKSQGLGKDWAKQNITHYDCMRGMPKGTKRTPVPRYYITKLVERSETPELTEYAIKTARTRTALKYDAKRTDYWQQKGRNALLAKIEADYQAEREKLARDKLKESKL